MGFNLDISYDSLAVRAVLAVRDFVCLSVGEDESVAALRLLYRSDYGSSRYLRLQVRYGLLN